MKQFGSFKLDTSNECLWRGTTQIALAPKPFAVLRYLVEHPARLVTHDELLDALWPETYVQPQVLRTYVLELRKVLGDLADERVFIQTLPKRGYCFVSPVAEADSAKVLTPVVTALVRTTPPALLANPCPTSTVGREKELAQLWAKLQLVSDAQRQVLFLTGEAGIGKSALVEAFCQQLEAQPSIMIARGQCVEGFGAKQEYYPVMEVLGQLCASPDGERACRILAELAPSWLTAPRQPVEPIPSGAPVAAQLRVPGDLCAALEELSAEKPLLLVFEDLNWADDSTLHLISALARRRAAARLFVIATYRPQSTASEHPLKGLKQDLLMRRLCTELALAPMGKSAVRELLIRRLAQPCLPARLDSFVHQHSEGNPLFAIAILEHLIVEKFLVRSGADETAPWEQRAPFEDMEAGVPVELAQMIELEIDRLSAREQRMLEAGSLISVAFPAWAVAAALQDEDTAIEELLDDLARRVYFLERAGQDELPHGRQSNFYVFAHRLYRDVLYQRQSATSRARRHVRIAERLIGIFHGQTSNVAREIAFHYEAAGQWINAVDALHAAALHARQRRAYAEAIDLFEHALRLAANLLESESSHSVQQIQNELLLVRDTARNAAFGGTEKEQILVTQGY